HPVHHPVPGRPRPLLGDDEPVDDGPGSRDASPDAEAGGATQTVQPNAGEGDRRRAGSASRRRGSELRLGRRVRHAARGQEEARREAEAMSGPGVQVEATGETVGEAKWAALRDLEQLVPGLDREAVEFEVLSEGERGLLGVGYTPARVIAHAPETAVASV